jgi:hypothetical protein
LPIEDYGWPKPAGLPAEFPADLSLSTGCPRGHFPAEPRFGWREVRGDGPLSTEPLGSWPLPRQRRRELLPVAGQYLAIELLPPLDHPSEPIISLNVAASPLSHRASLLLR